MKYFSLQRKVRKQKIPQDANSSYNNNRVSKCDWSTLKSEAHPSVEFQVINGPQEKRMQKHCCTSKYIIKAVVLCQVFIEQ